MAVSPQALRATEQMLLQMFSLSELRRLVRYLPDGGALVQELPGQGASPRSMAEAVVELLDRRGRLDAAFFQHVMEERPRRRSEVEAVKALVDAQAAVPAPVVSRPSALPATPAGVVETSQYNVFLGHSSPDKPVARTLYPALVARGLSVFFDEVSLLPGDIWVREIPKALRVSSVVLMLHSEQTEPGFYALEEMTEVIARVRQPGATQRLVPVFVDGYPGRDSQLPYGLRNFNGLSLKDLGADGVAQKIAELVRRMEKG